MTVDVASESLWPLACRLAVGEANPNRAESMLNLVRTGLLDPRGIYLAWRGGVVLGAISAQILPGGSGVILPPRSLDAESRRALLNASVEFLVQSGCETIHCAIAPGEEIATRTLLHAAGFVRLGVVQNYICELDPERTGSTSIADECSFVQYNPALQSEFRRTVQRSYHESQDFPELQEFASGRDPLLGFTFGQSQPPNWWLLRDDFGHPLGVVILAESVCLGNWELAYLGVIPEARDGASVRD